MIADVRKLVSEDTGKFFIGEQIEQTGGHGHRIAVLIDAACESIQLWIVNDIDFGHIHIARHTEVFNDVIDARILLSRQRSGTGSLPNHCRIGEESNRKPQQYAADYPRKGTQKVVVYDLHVQFVNRFAELIVI